MAAIIQDMQHLFGMSAIYFYAPNSLMLMHLWQVIRNIVLDKGRELPQQALTSAQVQDWRPVAPLICPNMAIAVNDAAPEMAIQSQIPYLSMMRFFPGDPEFFQHRNKGRRSNAQKSRRVFLLRNSHGMSGLQKRTETVNMRPISQLQRQRKLWCRILLGTTVINNGTISHHKPQPVSFFFSHWQVKCRMIDCMMKATVQWYSGLAHAAPNNPLTHAIGKGQSAHTLALQVSHTNLQLLCSTQRKAQMIRFPSGAQWNALAAQHITNTVITTAKYLCKIYRRLSGLILLYYRLLFFVSESFHNRVSYSIKRVYTRDNLV